MKKSKTRLFVEKKISLNLILYIKGKQHHFLKNVLRIKLDEKLNLFDGVSGEWQGRIISISRDKIGIKIQEKIRDFENEPDIWLVFAPIKLFRLNITIQKATELGVSKFIPCKTEFSNFDKLNYKNIELNAVEASEQCERLEIPKVEKIMNLELFINNFPNDRALIFCDESEEALPNIYEEIKNKINIYTKWAVIIGPEGGFSNSEKNLIIRKSNVLRVTLGKRILRSDTAAIASLFCLQSLADKRHTVLK